MALSFGCHGPGGSETGSGSDGGPDGDASAADGGVIEDLDAEPVTELPTCEDTRTSCGAAGCVELSTNSQHCGTCDRDCLRGGCEAGHCQPELLQFQLEWGADDRSLVVEDGWVYYTHRSYIRPLRIWGYGIERLPADARGRAFADGFAGSEHVIGGVQMNNDHVYWLDYTAGSILRRAADLSAPPKTVVKGLGSVSDYSVGAGRLVWSNVDDGSLETSLASGDSAQTVLVDGLHEPRGLSMDDDYVYVLDWIESESKAELLRVRYDGAVVPLASSTGTGEVMVDDGEVFWMSISSGGTVNLFSVSRAGGPRRTWTSFEKHGAADFALDDDYVYWSTEREDGGKITRLPRDGGPGEIVIARETIQDIAYAESNQSDFLSDPWPGGIDVGEDYVYWNVGDTRSILRVAK